MKNLLILSVVVAVYLLVGMTPFGRYINFPINMVVTFLHEFGHAFFCKITGGSVTFLHMDPTMDSLHGYATIGGLTGCVGGNETIVLMGGYVGSAVFGNLLLRVSLTKYAYIAVYILSFCMAFSGLWWFSNVLTTVCLLIYAVVFFGLAGTKIIPYVLQFVGVVSLIFIVQDFNVGPTGDLDLYNQYVSKFPPEVVLMYLWLGVVLLITYLNVKNIISMEKQKAI